MVVITRWSHVVVLHVLQTKEISNLAVFLFIMSLQVVTNSLEQFSIECRKTKTKVITTANQNKDKYQNEPMRTQSKYR